MRHSTSTLTLHAFKDGVPQQSRNYRPNRVSERPPSLNPLDFEEKPLMPWSHRANPSPPPSRNQRPSISSPYAFRRLDQTETQKQGLIPLRLGPVVLRDSPSESPNLPHPPEPALSRGNTQSDSTDDLLADDDSPHSYRENRESPFQRCQQQSSNAKSGQTPGAQVEVTPTTFDDIVTTPTRPPLTVTTSTGFARRTESDAPVSSTKPRISNERSRLRKHSLPALRKDDRLEQEILELNTIVEERRAENARDKRSSQHVPAVAPSMQVRARSETLNSIGSALSRTLPTRSKQDQQRIPDTSMPHNGIVQRPNSASSWSSSRFSDPISDVLPSSPANLPNGELFYKCRMDEQPRRTVSEASMSTFLTELDPPSLTTSSPMSRGHSRHLTDESQTTSLSPYTPGNGTHSRDLSKSDKETRQWPFFTMTNTEVGVAF